MLFSSKYLSKINIFKNIDAKIMQYVYVCNYNTYIGHCISFSNYHNIVILMLIIQKNLEDIIIIYYIYYFNKNDKYLLSFILYLQ